MIGGKRCILMNVRWSWVKKVENMSDDKLEKHTRLDIWNQLFVLKGLQLCFREHIPTASFILLSIIDEKTLRKVWILSNLTIKFLNHISPLSRRLYRQQERHLVLLKMVIQHIHRGKSYFIDCSLVLEKSDVWQFSRSQSHWKWMVCIGKKTEEVMEEPMQTTPQCKRINSCCERGVGDDKLGTYG